MSVMIALSPLAGAQTASDVDSLATTLDATAANRGQAQVAGKIAANFTSLAGSDKNALALVNALRNGTNATLTYPAPTTTGAGTGTTTGTTPPATTTTTYDPPTGKMGWGNVKIALALAQYSLASAGITHPTAAQLQAALNGGDVTVTNADGTTTTTTLKGVLQMRADGMGWGQIAQANGTKLGPVVSGLKMANTKIAALPPTNTTTSTPASVATSKSTLASKGITTAAGSSVSPSHGNGGSQGLVTANGASAGTSHGNAYGRGIVTAAGGGATAGATVAANHGQGAGVVTAAGGAATSITTAQGNSGSHGKPENKGKGGG
jgi:hypothetical protein